MKGGMAKKTTPKRIRVSEKTPPIKNPAASGTSNKPARLKKGSTSEVSLKETLSVSSTEEKDHRTADVVQPNAVVLETSETKSAQSSAGEMPMTVLPASSTKPPLEADTRATKDRPEVAAPEVEEVLELLAFRLADEEYVVDILMIKEIIRLMEITRVPRRPAFIKGVISLRGTIIPVFDLRTRLGLLESPPDRNTRILVVGLGKGLIGVIADRVTDVVKVKLRDVEPAPAVRGGSSAGHLKGVTRMNERLLILLDLEKTVTLE
jgi:purine-binding chemotaxis protein CheW